MKLYRSRSLAVITLVVIGGTAVSRAANDVRVSRQVTAAEIGTVAVMTFDGSKGNVFSDLVVHELLQRGAKLVERTKLAASFASGALPLMIWRLGGQI